MTRSCSNCWVLARMLELCKARLRYSLPSRRTVQRELQLLGAEGRTAGRNMCVNLLKSGVKLTITGDLWSENGMGLFGIYAHGILESTDEKGEEKWAMVKSLIGLVACESVGGPFLAALRRVDVMPPLIRDEQDVIRVQRREQPLPFDHAQLLR